MMVLEGKALRFVWGATSQSIHFVWKCLRQEVRFPEVFLSAERLGGRRELFQEACSCQRGRECTTWPCSPCVIMLSTLISGAISIWVSASLPAASRRTSASFHVRFVIYCRFIVMNFSAKKARMFPLSERDGYFRYLTCLFTKICPIAFGLRISEVLQNRSEP